jgi:hypothetical protein
MTRLDYFSGTGTGRQKYARPQAVLFADNPGTLIEGSYVPTGYEVGEETAGSNFIILSDDNRGPLNFSSTRIETRKRTVNGRMRSYHIADKLTLSLDWQMLPSRSFSTSPEFDTDTGKPTPGTGESLSNYPANVSGSYLYQYTTDGGAGGVEIKDWYDNHSGSFWVYLSYDNYSNFESVPGITDKYANLAKYSQVIEVFIADFSYSVEKRGSHNHDLWNISMSLEEV